MRRFLWTMMTLTLILPGCASNVESRVTRVPTVELLATSSALPAALPVPPEADLYQVTTQNNPSGNRHVTGSIDLASAQILDIPIDGTPQWLVSAPFQEGVVFVTVMEDGEAQTFKVTDQAYESVPVSPAELPAGMPPLLTVSGGTVQLVVPPADASPLTTPVIANDKLIYIGSNGDLVSVSDSVQARLPVHALPDSRILLDEQDRVMVLGQSTDRYDHGVLGDAIEASAILLMGTDPELRILQTIVIDPPDVVEGISPIWADIDNDGVRDVIVTLSNNQGGARIAAFREDGSLLAESDPIGLGHRWRHQIAVASFDGNRMPLLASIRTPHIGGIVEYFRYNAGKLEIVQEISGFSTHSIGSRNLDSGLAGDFNADGVIELLVPDQTHTSLAVLSIDGVLAAIALPGKLTSNLSASEIDGELYIGAGTQGSLRIWIP